MALNEAQQQAVTMNGHCLITACPGSGKTTVLMHRAAHLLQHSEGNALCGVTFTSESAAELESRIRLQFPSAGRRLTCGTFHSLCKKQLQLSGVRVKLVSPGQQMDLLRRAWSETLGKDSGCPFDSAQAYVDSVKSAVDPILPPVDVEPRRKVYERYQELLHQLGVMDFSDLLIESARGMQRGSVKPLPVTHMLVDEFQDTDPVQLAWVRAHLKQGVQVTVVGDDDQSIYGWRSAMGHRGMSLFKESARAAHVSLDITYRCPQEVIAPASRLIVHNTDRIPKSLRSANREPGSARVRRFSSRDEECQAICDAIALSGTPGTWGILARTNSQLEHLEEVIAGRVPTRRSGGRSFWELRAPSLFLSVCQSLASGDMIGVSEVLRNSGVGPERLAGIQKACQSRSQGALSRFLDDRSNTSLRDPVGRLQARIREWQKLTSDGDFFPALYGIATYIATFVRLYQRPSGEEAHQRDIGRLNSCAKAIGRLRGSLGQRIMALTQKDGPSEDESAKLMTLHSSKGLEFPDVWIMGCEEGMLPSSKAPLDEERRLFYVGMTRSKSSLVVSHILADNGAPSRFISEAGLS